LFRPTFTVGKGERRARGGFTRYEEIDRPVDLTEVEEVKKAGKDHGLWRFEDNLWLDKPVEAV
jgi:hypothetical protein